MNYNKIKEMLIEEEGMHLTPYKDSKGIWTIGIGKAETSPLTSLEKTLLGVSYIEDIKSIDKDTAMWLLDNEIMNKLILIRQKFDWFEESPEYVKNIVLDICFNIGVEGFGKFKKTISYLRNKDYKSAAVEILDSSYLTDVKGRALRLSIYMATGQLINIEQARDMYAILEKRL